MQTNAYLLQQQAHQRCQTVRLANALRAHHIHAPHFAIGDHVPVEIGKHLATVNVDGLPIGDFHAVVLSVRDRRPRHRHATRRIRQGFDRQIGAALKRLPDGGGGGILGLLSQTHQLPAMQTRSNTVRKSRCLEGQ
jgi:hypothetical protein